MVAAANAPAPAASASPSSKPKHSGNSTTAATPSLNATNIAEDDGDEDDDGQATLAATAPIFVHVLFSGALVVLIISLIRALRLLGRVRVYGTEAPISPVSTQWPPELGADPSAAHGPAVSPARLVRALIGAPPVKGPTPTLPSYNQALQQSARQEARREAAEARIPGYTAGRRGREQIGTGDADDLVRVYPGCNRLTRMQEIERVKRLGGAPPAYRSDDMRGPVLDRGPAGPRRRWRTSWLSVVASDDGASSPTRASRRVSAVTSMLADLLRRVSFAPSSNGAPSEPPTPQLPAKARMTKMSLQLSPVGHELDLDGHVSMMMTERERGASAPAPLPSPIVTPTDGAVSSPRRIRFADRGHLRQRSSTSGAVLGLPSPPTSARSTASAVVIEVEEPRTERR